MYFFFNDTATTEIYTLFPTRRSSDLGQFVTTPTDPDEAVSLDEEASTEADEAGGWQDEAFTTAESGYPRTDVDRKSTRLNSSHANISYAVFCLKKKKKILTYSY